MFSLGNDEYFATLDFATIKFTFGETPSAIWNASWADHPLKVTKVK